MVVRGSFSVVGAIAWVLVACITEGCGGGAAVVSESVNVPTASVAEAVTDSSPETNPDLRQHPGLRWLSTDANWIFLVDAARLRQTTFQQAMLACFDIPQPDSVFPPEVWDNVDAVLAGGRGDGGVAVVTGNLAGSLSRIEAAFQDFGVTRTTIGGHEALFSDRVTYVAIDDRNLVILFGTASGSTLAETSGPSVLSRPEVASLWDTAAGGSPDSPALLEFFVADGEGGLADIDVLMRIGCAACDESLKFDSAILYPDADIAAHMATGFGEILQSLEDETSDARALGVSPDDSFVRVSGREFHLHQALDDPSNAFHDGLVLLYVLGVSLHPPNMGL